MEVILPTSRISASSPYPPSEFQNIKVKKTSFYDKSNEVNPGDSLSPMDARRLACIFTDQRVSGISPRRHGGAIKPTVVPVRETTARALPDEESQAGLHLLHQFLPKTSSRNFHGISIARGEQSY